MRKSLLIMFLLFAAGITANAQKFALIDMEYILKNIPAYQSASNELNQVSKQWQNEVEKLGKEAKLVRQLPGIRQNSFRCTKDKERRRDCCQREIRSRTAPQILRSGRRTFQKA